MWVDVCCIERSGAAWGDIGEAVKFGRHMDQELRWRSRLFFFYSHAELTMKRTQVLKCCVFVDVASCFFVFCSRPGISSRLSRPRPAGGGSAAGAVAGDFCVDDVAPSGTQPVLRRDGPGLEPGQRRGSLDTRISLQVVMCMPKLLV